MIVDPADISTRELHGYLLSSVVPRPIAFASTIDATGNVNLSPFSFFNCFGTNPPVLVFSPSRRGRNNTIKHTLENVRAVKEVVINLVDFKMVQQMSLSSGEYERGVNEFIKAGLTEVPSDKVRPPRVGESPVAFECFVQEIKELGSEGGAGNLVICEVLRIHINEDVMDEKGGIDPFKLDAVARMGSNFYCRVNEQSIFEIVRDNLTPGIGIDQLPEKIRRSTVLTGNELAQLASVDKIPATDLELAAGIHEGHVEIPKADVQLRNHILASGFLARGDIKMAWQCLLSDKG